MKRVFWLVILVAGLSLILVSCGSNVFKSVSDENSEEACKYEVTKSLDEGQYDTVINKLQDGGRCASKVSNEDKNMYLAAAYMGKGGVDMNEILNDVIDANVGEDAYKSFVSAIGKSAKGQNIPYLDQAGNYYGKVAPDCNSPQNDLQKDACFYTGILDLQAATTSLALLIGGEEEDIAQAIQDWIDGTTGTKTLSCQKDVNQDKVTDEAQASACAIEYANSGVCIDTTDTDYTVTGPKALIFTKGSINYNYNAILITISASSPCTTNNNSIRLIDSVVNSPALTERFCQTDFSSCSNVVYNLNTNTCWPCPVVKDEGGSYTVNEMVVDTINSGMDNILALLPAGQQLDVQEAVEKFKQEVCGSSTCTQQQIANYLTKKK